MCRSRSVSVEWALPTLLLYAPNAEIIKAAVAKRNTKPGKGLLLVIGDPLGDLVGAEKEARAIGKAASGEATLLLRGNATLNNVRDACRTAELIHFATHGVYLEDAPLSSGILLHLPVGMSGTDLTEFGERVIRGRSTTESPSHGGRVITFSSNTDGRVVIYRNEHGLVYMKRYDIAGAGRFVSLLSEDRNVHGHLLTGYEIRHFDLSQCSHVTLSCCRATFVNPYDRVSEFNGIIRGFLAAGIPSVVANPWPIPDDVTFRFIREFYEDTTRPARASSLYRRSRAFCDTQRRFILGPRWTAGSEDYLLLGGFLFYGVG